MFLTEYRILISTRSRRRLDMGWLTRLVVPRPLYAIRIVRVSCDVRSGGRERVVRKQREGSR